MQLEFEVVQNPVLGAMVHWQFVKAWGDTSDNPRVPLPWIFFVLPFAYHSKASKVIAHTHQASGIFMALQRDPEILVGLQERIERMADCSLVALQLAVSSGLLDRSPSSDWPAFMAARKTLPAEHQPQNPTNKTPLHAAKRLGVWFSQMSLAHACAVLNVRF